MAFSGMPVPGIPGQMGMMPTARTSVSGLDQSSYSPSPSAAPKDSFQAKNPAMKPVKPLTFGQKLKEVGKGFGKSILGAFSWQGLAIGGLLIGVGMLAPPLAAMMALGGAIFGGFSFVKSIVDAQKNGWTKESCQDVGAKSFGMALGFVGMRLAGAAGALGKGGTAADDFLSLNTLKNIFTGKFSDVGKSAKSMWNDSVEGTSTTVKNLFNGKTKDKLSMSKIKKHAEEMRYNPVGAAMDAGGAAFMGQALRRGGHVPTTALMIDGAKPEKPKDDEK